MNLAQLIDAIPLVQSTADRAARFGNPATDQRVFNKGTGNIERWNGASWVTDIAGSATALGWVDPANPLFGADTTLVADATAAFQAAENARAVVRGTLAPSVGNYRINGTVTVSSNDATWILPPGAILNAYSTTGPAILVAGTAAFIEHIVFDGLRIIAGAAAYRIPLLTIGNSFAVERFSFHNTVLDGASFDRDGILLDRVWEGHFDYVEFLNFTGGIGIQHRATDLNAGNIHFDTVTSTSCPVLFLFNENPGQGNLTNSLQFSNCKLARLPGLAANKFFAGTSNGVANAGATTVTLTGGQGANYVAGDWVVYSSISGNKIFADRVANVAGDVLTLTAPTGLPFALAASDPVVAGYWHTVLGPNIRLAEFIVPHFERCNGVLGSGAHGVKINCSLAGVALLRGAYLVNNCQGWMMDTVMQTGVNLSASAVLLHSGPDANNNRNRLCGAIKVTGLTNYYQADAPSSMLCVTDNLGGTNTLLGIWQQETTVAANQAAVQLAMRGQTAARSMRMRSRGAIAAMSVQVSTARSAGTLTVTVYKNGAAQGFTAVIDGTNTIWKVTEQITEAGFIGFAPGDTIDVRVTTDGAWAPTANNLDVALYAAT